MNMKKCMLFGLSAFTLFGFFEKSCKAYVYNGPLSQPLGKHETSRFSNSYTSDDYKKSMEECLNRICLYSEKLKDLVPELRALPSNKENEIRHMHLLRDIEDAHDGVMRNSVVRKMSQCNLLAISLRKEIDSELKLQGELVEELKNLTVQNQEIEERLRVSVNRVEKLKEYVTYLEGPAMEQCRTIMSRFGKQGEDIKAIYRLSTNWFQKTYRNSKSYCSEMKKKNCKNFEEYCLEMKKEYSENFDNCDREIKDLVYEVSLNSYKANQLLPEANRLPLIEIIVRRFI